MNLSVSLSTVDSRLRTSPSYRLLTAGDQPTKAESEEDVSIDATPEAAFGVLLADDPAVVKSDKGDKSMKEFEAW